MKYYGQITDDKDLVNKKYVDDNSGSTPNDGKLKLGLDSEEAIDLFSANQSSNSTLTLVGGTNITLSRDQVDRNKITITGSGGGTIYDSNLNLSINGGTAEKVFSANAEKAGTINLSAGTGISLSQSGSSITITNTGSSGGSSYYKYSISTASADTLSVPTSYKNVVVKFYYSSLVTPGAGSGKSYVLNFANSMSEGNEMFLYLRNAGDTAGVNITVPKTLTYTTTGANEEVTTTTYPVIYNGYYTNNDSYSHEIINLTYSDSSRVVSFAALTLHIYFDGEVYYINKLHFQYPSVN